MNICGEWFLCVSVCLFVGNFGGSSSGRTNYRTLDPCALQNLRREPGSISRPYWMITLFSCQFVEGLRREGVCVCACVCAVIPPAESITRLRSTATILSVAAVVALEMGSGRRRLDHLTRLGHCQHSRANSTDFPLQHE